MYSKTFVFMDKDTSNLRKPQLWGVGHRNIDNIDNHVDTPVFYHLTALSPLFPLRFSATLK